MDSVFVQAVAKVAEMPLNTQRFIGEVLLDGSVQPDLPVIQFTAEEEAMVEEGLADLDAGHTHSQEEMSAHFAALRAKSYAAV